MTPREENEVISMWAGLECRCEATDIEFMPKWWYCPRHSNNGNPPDYDRDEVTISLVPTLKAKGYAGSMFYHAEGYEFRAYHPKDEGMVWCSGTKEPTIAAAIKAACKRILEIESEGSGEVDAAGN